MPRAYIQIICAYFCPIHIYIHIIYIYLEFDVSNIKLSTDEDNEDVLNLRMFHFFYFQTYFIFCILFFLLYIFQVDEANEDPIDSHAWVASSTFIQL